ncbi:MAG: tyrosine-type recombinase/integrase [Geminicoccaceae bacterium]
MARTLRNGKLDTRTARAKLAVRREPYWTVLVQGAALGYRRSKKAGTWIARWRDAAGKQHYRSLGAADDALDADGVAALSFAQAQDYTRGWIAALVGDAAASSGAPHTVNDALDTYLEWLARHRRSARDATWKADALIRPKLGQVPLSRLTASTIRQWHEELAEQPARLRSRRKLDNDGRQQAQRFRAPPETEDGRRARRASANRVLTILKAALNRAYHDGKVPTDDAWRRVKPFTNADAARLRYLSQDECTRLLNACEPFFRKLVRAALLTGCRYGELARLEARDLDLDAGMLHVRTSKSGRPRHVPLDDEALAFLRSAAAALSEGDLVFRQASGRAWGVSEQRRPLLGAALAARMAEVNFHALRHTWASHRIMAGAPLMVVAQVLGHADTRMVERHYGHLSPGYVHDVVRRTALGIGAGIEDNVAALGQRRIA